MTTVSWLHLSDWHQHGTEFDRKIVRDGLLDDIRKCRQEFPDLAQIDLVFFTGDLAYHGKAEEYRAAQTQLLDPVLAAVEREKDHLFIIPGNHDLNRNAYDHFEQKTKRVPKSSKDFEELLAEGFSRYMALSPFLDYQAWSQGYGAAGFGAFADSKVLTLANGKRIGIMGGFVA